MDSPKTRIAARSTTSPAVRLSSRGGPLALAGICKNAQNPTSDALDRLFRQSGFDRTENSGFECYTTLSNILVAF